MINSNLMLSKQSEQQVCLFFPPQVSSFPFSGVSETDRQKRKESNLFTTKMNFIAWLLEVLIGNIESISSRGRIITGHWVAIAGRWGSHLPCSLPRTSACQVAYCSRPLSPVVQIIFLFHQMAGVEGLIMDCSTIPLRHLC